MVKSLSFYLLLIITFRQPCAGVRKLNQTLSCCRQKEERGHAITEGDISTSSVKIIPAKMIHIPAGTFEMGTSEPAFGDAHPVHKVALHEFWIDEHEVTNAEFKKFVNATHYITVAERN